jgi:CHAT domain-containing protein/tetratricopeptide (TPR) repeat protein
VSDRGEARYWILKQRLGKLDRYWRQMQPRVAAEPKTVIGPLQKLNRAAETLAGQIAAWEAVPSPVAAAWGHVLVETARQLRIFGQSGIADAHMMTADYAAAREDCRRGLALTKKSDPERAILFEVLGKTEFEAGDLAAAQSALAEALTIYQRFARPSRWVDRIGAGVEFTAEMKRFMARKAGEGVARSCGFLAHLALARGDREGYARALDQAYEAARNSQQPGLIRSIWRQRYEYALRWDASGAVLDAMNAELDRGGVPELAGDEAYKIDIQLLRGQGLIEREGYARADARLKAALDAARSPRERWTTHMAYARFCAERPGRRQEAIRLLDEALAIGEETGIAGFIDSARRDLIRLLISGGTAAERRRAIAELEAVLRACRDAQDREGFARALLQRAMARFLDGDYPGALKDIDGALDFATEIQTRGEALTARSAALQRLGRDEEALAAAIGAVGLFPERRYDPFGDGPGAGRDELQHIEAAHAAAARICARLGRTAEGFEWAERGRGRLLSTRRKMIAPLGTTSPSAILPALVEALARHRDGPAALALFSVGPVDMVVFVVAPSRPVREVSAEFGEPQLRQILPAADDGPQQWNAGLADALPRISEALQRPLAAIEETVEACKTLYIVPDSHLHSIPFAALTGPGGIALVERCATVVVPSAASLLASLGRSPQQTKSCLTLGAGGVGEISFAAHAEAVAERFAGEPGWAERSLHLPEPEATPERFLAEAARFRVIHLACHGNVLAGVMDTLSASALQLTGGDLTARALIKAEGPWLGADLVFLNACRSGDFRARLAGEVGGFRQAFLEAGVPSLVATLFYVNPGHAQELAGEFYRHWLNGQTKAEALRRAQCTLRERGLPVGDWAAHMLIGRAV